MTGKKYLTILCLIAYCLTIVKTILPLVEYKVNFNFIIQELCINKDKPESGCNGKCHLKKELSKAQETEKSKQTPHNQLTKNEISEYLFNGTEKLADPIHPLLYENYWKNMKYSLTISSDIFHPPQQPTLYC